MPDLSGKHIRRERVFDRIKNQLLAALLGKYFREAV